MTLPNAGSNITTSSKEPVASGKPLATEALLSMEQGRSLAELEAIARRIRRHVIKMTAKASSGHPGGSLSATDIITALYFQIMRYDPRSPRWEGRDRFVLSKGHAAPALYATLAEAGFFPTEDLSTLRQIGSHLQGHVHVTTPGVEMCAGSLGQGVSIAVGIALAVRLDGLPGHVFALLGDGECNEGEVWEAAMSVPNLKLKEITVIVDRNRQQNDGWMKDIMDVDPIADKWRAFGWQVEEIDGHNMAQVVDALARARSDGHPTAIIALTVKGKGVSFMENNPEFHGKAPTPEQAAQALRELE